MTKLWLLVTVAVLFMSSLHSGAACRTSSGHIAMKTCTAAQLVQQFKDHPSDPKIIGHVSDAMALMAQKSGGNCREMAEQGLIPAILKAMDTFEKDMWVQRYACSLVGSLSSGNTGCPQSNRDSLRESGAAARVERALAHGETDHYVQDYCKESLAAINLGAVYRTPEPSEQYRQARLKNRRDLQLDRIAKRAAADEV